MGQFIEERDPVSFQELVVSIGRYDSEKEEENPVAASNVEANVGLQRGERYER